MESKDRTLVLIKNDAIERGLADEIIGKFENVGLRIVERKEIVPTREMIEQHYPAKEPWLIIVAQKAEVALGREDFTKVFGKSASYKEIGLEIREWIIRDMTGKKVIAMILKGEDVAIRAKEIVGVTCPAAALEGTIRDDLCKDSIRQSLLERRPVNNLVHCADPKKVKEEIEIWFPELC